MAEPATGAALVVQGLGKRYRLGRGGGLVPVPLFGNRLDRMDRDRRRDAEDDDELDEDEELDEPEERPSTGPARELWALRDVNLVVEPGEAVGIVGPTGSGKSTLMKMLGRITPPTEGRIEVQGCVAPMLGSLSGFVVAEATVRANVGILARFLGVPHAVAARNLASILRFADLTDRAGGKMKHLSPGMQERLAYAVGLHLESDILLADDKVATGDPGFRARCHERIEEALAQGAAMVMASHRLNEVTSLCRRSVWLDGGRVKEEGPGEQVVEHYRMSLRPPDPPPPPAAGGLDAPAAPSPPDFDPVAIVATRMVTPDGDPAPLVSQGDTAVAEIELDVRESGVIMLGWVAFREGEHRRRFVAPVPHVAEHSGRYVMRARLTLAGIVAGTYVGRAQVLVNRVDGRASDLLRSEAFRFTLEAADIGGGEQPSATWTVSAPVAGGIVALS